MDEKSNGHLPPEEDDRIIALARENLEVQYDALETFRHEMDDAKEEARRKPSRYQGLCQSYQRQYEVVTRAEETLERLETCRDEKSHWGQRAEEISKALTEQYGDRGPQYEILIRRASQAEVAAEQLERSGRGIETNEWRAANRAVLDAIQGLQKYTESQKTEQLQIAQQRAMVVVLELVERIVAPKQPELWASVVEEIRLALPDGIS